MKTFASSDHRLHFPKGELEGGVMVRPYECPERWEHIVAALHLAGQPVPEQPLPVPHALLARVHTDDYLAFLASAWDDWTAGGYPGEALPTVFPARRMQQRVPNAIDGKLGYYALALETAITAGTWRAALSSASCAYSAQQTVSDGATASFALCRPPGHHAAADLYGGYCFLNNAAIAAEGLREAGAARVAVIDVDFHHGNGTQDIFYDRDDVLFVSLHGEPKEAFPHFLGYADETGIGAGEGSNLNYPLPPGCTWKKWSEALDDALSNVTSRGAEAVVVSLGVDTFHDDPISFFTLASDDFLRIGERIAQLGLPTVFVMEGGYAVAEVGTNAVNVLVGFEGAVA
jgi:acetoin utilization deacetylase AcuC-like enzyme